MTLADRIVVLRAGEVEQVGTPLELYNGPVNQFVAGFIGSPRMSFLAARIASVTGGRIEATLHDGQAIAFERGERAPPAPGETVMIGVRPQQLALGDGPGSMGARIILVEQLGAETVVHAMAGEDRLLAVLPGQLRLQPGDTARFAVSKAPLHVFDSTGLRLNAPVEG
jgi:multiple sugar transport system ATP-binding protein